MKGSYSAVDAAAEAERLRQQVMSIGTRERDTLRRLGLRPGLRVLDLGCGPAASLRRIIAEDPPSFALGVDRDPRHLALAARFTPALRCDAAALPLAAESFDFVLIRFLLRHLPHPEPVVREAARVVARGGIVCAVDADDSAWVLTPEPPSFAALSSALAQSARRRGGDPTMGRRLKQLLHESGLVEVRSAVVPVTTDDVAPRSFMDIFLAPGARPLDADLLPDSAAAWNEVARWAERPDAFGWVVGVFAAGKKP